MYVPRSTVYSVTKWETVRCISATPASQTRLASRGRSLRYNSLLCRLCEFEWRGGAGDGVTLGNNTCEIDEPYPLGELNALRLGLAGRSMEPSPVGIGDKGSGWNGADMSESIVPNSSTGMVQEASEANCSHDKIDPPRKLRSLPGEGLGRRKEELSLDLGGVEDASGGSKLIGSGGLVGVAGVSLVRVRKVCSLGIAGVGADGVATGANNIPTSSRSSSLSASEIWLMFPICCAGGVMVFDLCRTCRARGDSGSGDGDGPSTELDK